MTNIQSKQNTTFIMTSQSIIIKDISSLSSCQKRTVKNNIRKNNPNIFEFSIDSHFIYEPIFSDNLFYNLKDNNIIKTTNEENIFLKNIIESIDIQIDDRQIYVLPFFKLLLDNVKKVEPILNERVLIIKEIIESSPKNMSISLSKITSEYYKIAEKKGIPSIKKSSIHNILRNKLFYRFRKIPVKTNKLINVDNIRKTFYFIKILIRSLKLGITPIYIDECGFFLKNNNFRNWICRDDEYFCKVSNVDTKLNLIMAVSSTKIFHYKINRASTTSLEFKIFFEELLDKMTNEEKKNHIFIMDNLKAHLTLELFELYYNNNLKILFNIPYKSSFNMIEKVFRYIKNLTYKQIFSSQNKFVNKIIEIIESEKLKITLKKLFKETLNIYEDFIKSNSIKNLNL